MKKLLNTLYTTTPDLYLSLDGENVAVKKDENIIGRIPLHNLDSIVTFGYTGASPVLMGKCASMNIGLCFLSSSGQFKAKVTGKAYRNILLRREQYRIADDEQWSISIARNFIIGKIYNEKSVIMRAVRDHEMRVDVQQLKKVAEQLQAIIESVYHQSA